MASVIHGNSAELVKYFRKDPAALALFWIYCARRNNEGVAWPSLRGLAHDTGWSFKACQKARVWLVDRKIISRVEDYIRPQWRNLPPDELAKKRNLDHAEYYRVTGTIEINGSAWPLLYENPQQGDFADGNSIPDPADDVPQRSTTRVDIGSQRSELASKRTKHNTKKAVVADQPAKNGKTAAAAEIETSAEPTPLQLAYAAYEKNIGIIPQFVGEQIGAAVADYPNGWVEDAIKEAALSNVRNWKYIAAILQRWEKDGRAPKAQQPAPQPAQPRRAADPHCPMCGGQGSVIPDFPRGHALYGKTIPCPTCVDVAQPAAVTHA